MEWFYNIFINIVPFILVLSVLVYIHEMGHYIVARLNGVKVEAFSIGFGAEIFGWNNKNGTRWKICCLPFGGYVKLHNETLADAASDAMQDKDSLVSKTVWQRIAVAGAGPLANYLLAIVILFVINITLGQKVFNGQIKIDKILSESMAESSGLLEKDIIFSIDNEKNITPAKLLEKVNSSPGKKLQFGVIRENEKIEIGVIPELQNNRSTIGIKLQQMYIRKPLGFFAGFIGACEYVYNFSVLTLKSLYSMIKGEISADGLSGPIGIANMTATFAQQGFMSLLWLSAILSINLGLINLFPLPMLDGGHIAMYLIEAVKGKPLSVKCQEWIARFGAVFLISLALFVTWKDLSRIKLVQVLINWFN